MIRLLGGLEHLLGHPNSEQIEPNRLDNKIRI